jgi:ribosomal protein S18 acetylase RimI-like enzyme
LLTRSFKKADEDAVVELWNECGLTRRWNNPAKDIARKLTVQPELFLVGEKDGKIVATVMAGYDGHRGWVNYLAVAPEHRRQGFGRLLMRQAEERLLALGCPKLNVQVRKSNAEALGFYKSLGYARDEAVSLGKRLIPDQPTHRY